MDQWTSKVTARAELAELLHKRHARRATSAGLLLAELQAISAHGRKAKEADQLQQEQLAQVAAERTMQKELRQDIYAREDALRDRLVAVVGELSDSSDSCERNLGLWLSNLSYARYRFRSVTRSAKEPNPDSEAELDQEELRAVHRVPRADVLTRATGLEAFCRALLKPGREPVVDKLAMRGFSKEQLEVLAEDARKLINLGPNVKRAVAATFVEAQAVREQRLVWQRVRRLIRKAVAGVPELERKLASC